MVSARILTAACQNMCTTHLPSSTSHSRCQNACTKCVPSSHCLFGFENVFLDDHSLSWSQNVFPECLPSSHNFSRSQNACTKHLIISHSLSWPQNVCNETCTILTRSFQRSKCVHIYHPQQASTLLSTPTQSPGGFLGCYTDSSTNDPVQQPYPDSMFH